MKTRAAVLRDVGKPFEIVELDLDEPKADEVLIRFVASGLCHSDDHLRTGDIPVRYPIVGGHEGAGIVEQVGPGVTRLAVGDHVITSWLPVCGHCRFCSRGQTNLCDLGRFLVDNSLPDGTYRYEMVTDGLDEPFTFRIALTIGGDGIDVDYAGTSPQQSRGINVVYAYTFAMTAYALKCALLPELANNEGMFRALTVRAPEGSLLNARFPASVGGRICSGDYLPSLVFGALHQVIPDRVSAAPGSPLWSMVISGVRDDGKPYANVLFYNGGMGATSRKDGVSCCSWPNNIASTSVEVTERDTPFLVRYKRLREDSGGEGRHCGGLGQDILLESRSPTPMAAVFLAERTRMPAPGLAGGGSGGLGDVQINGRSIDVRRLHLLNEGDELLVRTPGAGGYGDARERPPDSIARDRLEGWRHPLPHDGVDGDAR